MARSGTAGSLLIISYPKVGDRNKDIESIKLKIWLCLGIKTYTHTHTFLDAHPDQTFESNVHNSS